MQKQWMIYGASTLSGKKVLSRALELAYQPVLAGPQGQELVELSFQTGLRCAIFNLDDSKKIEGFLKDIFLIVLCDSLSAKEHKRLLKACIQSRVHYIDMNNDLFSFEDVLKSAPKFQESGVTAIPGLHPSVILSDFVAASLKSHLNDANSLSLACSESFSSLMTLVNSLQQGGRVLKNAKVAKPDLAAETMLVPFSESNTLTVASAQADILAAWQSTRIPNVMYYRKAGEQEVRLRKNFNTIRWFLHFPFLKKLLRSQENFLIRHFGIKPFYSDKYAVWGKASNASGKSLTLRIEIVNDFDLALDVLFKVLGKVFEGEMRKGVLTSSQALGSDYWVQSQDLCLTQL